MVKKIYFLLFVLLSSHAVFAQNATLKGKITDADSNTPLPGAVIRFDEHKDGATTNENGEYTLANVVPGEYKIKVKYIGYKEYEQKVKFKAGQVMLLDIRLSMKLEDLQTVNIFGKLDKESDEASRSSEKNANNITNVVGAKAILKSPDINAANVLQRVSGVTIQRNSGGDEAFAVLRGIEPRYNNTLINGAKITSPDDKSRYVSLDVVPSELLQRIEVSKTLTPEMEGDAIGGTVNMVFKDAPDSMLFNASAAIGYSAIFLDRKFTTFSKKDIQAQSVYDRIGPTYVAQPSDFSKSNLVFNQVTAPPTATAGFAFGNRYLNKKLGILIADNFQNQYYGDISHQNPTSPDARNNYVPYLTGLSTRVFSNRQMNNGLVMHADYAINNRNKIAVDNVFLYTYFAQAYENIDTTIVGGNDPRTNFNGKPVPGTGAITEDHTSSTYHEEIENLKVDGKHILTDHLLFDWAGVFSSSARQAPDRADYSIEKAVKYVDTAVNKFQSTPYYYNGGSRIWQHNADKDYDAIANLTYRTKLNKSTLEIKIGGLYRHKERNNFQNEYVMHSLGGVADTIGSKQQFYNIYSARDSVLNPNGTAKYDLNNYHAFENITAAYGEFKITSDKLDVVGGVRMENTAQGYNFLQFELDAPNNVTKSYSDLMPSLNLKYKLNEKTNIRASYFKSISRPGYYELLPISQPPGNTGITNEGNDTLKHTTADNYDLRYEFFPKPDEQLFIGAFYKRLYNAIENAFSDGYSYKPVNADFPAIIYGAEIVYTKYWGNFGVTGNYAITHSDVAGKKKDPTTGNNVYEHRPLQGQANDELNISLAYKSDSKKLFIQLSYQYIGKTLYQINPNLGFDYYQQPQSYLSLSADKALSMHFTIFGKFNNLLNTNTIIKINNLVSGNDNTKASGLIGLRYTY